MELSYRSTTAFSHCEALSRQTKYKCNHSHCQHNSGNGGIRRLDRLQHQVDFDRADQDDGEQESCVPGMC